jgi:methionine synthase II (cobalamin-independent)
VTQTKPPYRAEHVGSLPRPDRLMAAREQYAAGKLSKAELTQIEDECIREAATQSCYFCLSGDFAEKSRHSVR